MRRWSLLLLGMLAGCGEPTIEVLVQRRIGETWYNANAKAAFENDAEAAMLPMLRQQLNGRQVYTVDGWLFSYDVYVYDVDWVDVNVGTRPPVLTVLADPPAQWTSDGSYDYINFDFTLDWAAGNGATVSFYMDLRPWFPDHTVTIYDIAAWGWGNAVARIPKNPAEAPQVTVTLFDARVNLSARAEGWFWTVDVSNRVRGMVNEILVRRLLGRMIVTSFGGGR